MIHTLPVKTIRKYKPEHFINERTQENIDKRRMFIPFGSDGSPAISLDKVCAIVEKVELVNEDIMVSFRVYSSQSEGAQMGTPCGKILQELIDAGANLTLYPCGVGSVKDGDVVGDDYKFAYFYIGSEA